MPFRVLALGAVMVASVGIGATAVPQDKSGSRLALLDRWIAAVGAHEPGIRDRPLEEFAALARADRQALVQIASKFTGFLQHPTEADQRDIPKETELERVRTRLVATELLHHTTADDWLHRAAAFHADVMMLASELTQKADLASPRDNKPMRELLVANDGEYQSSSERNWSLAFGRTLVADVSSPETDPFVGAWYHVTSTFLLSNAWLGELRPHLEVGEKLRPADEFIAFDFGTLYEAYGGGRVQAVVQGAAFPTGVRPDVPRAAVLFTTARNYYSRLLSSGPAFIEARVRYGRLLVDAERYDDAMSQFETALRVATDPVTLYYAHLFALRAEQARGHVDAAAAHGRAAATLFPTAQSAQIALSELSLLAGDLPAAGTAIDVIRGMPTNFRRDDPWWQYFEGAGRSATEIRAAVWSTLR